ncbi:hypothetical protein ACTI_08010 [Actinoplanes sp. OR16]|nr:hypothetical protein ACTI_08010 [Actinoplanes sp. OR16]
MIHSLPLEVVRTPCVTVVGRPDARLRRLVVGYSGFYRDSPVAHRVLPLTVAVLVIDFAGGARMVSGCGSGPAVCSEEVWGTESPSA